jgi:hypothetical protein
MSSSPASKKRKADSSSPKSSPKQSKKEKSPKPSRKESPKQSRKESPKQSRKESPKQSRKESPKQSRKEGSPKPSKKAKQQQVYHLNINNSLDKVHEKKHLSEVIKLQPSALQGLGDRADAMLNNFKVKTIEDLANWKFYKISHAIVVLAETEEGGKRDAKCLMNIDNALDKEYETKSLREILDAPVSALQGLSEWADKVLAPLHVKTVRDLGNWKYCAWASAMVELAKFEVIEQ